MLKLYILKYFSFSVYLELSNPQPWLLLFYTLFPNALEMEFPRTIAMAVLVSLIRENWWDLEVVRIARNVVFPQVRVASCMALERIKVTDIEILYFFSKVH